MLKRFICIWCRSPVFFLYMHDCKRIVALVVARRESDFFLNVKSVASVLLRVQLKSLILPVRARKGEIRARRVCSRLLSPMLDHAFCTRPKPHRLSRPHHRSPCLHQLPCLTRLPSLLKTRAQDLLPTRLLIHSPKPFANRRLHHCLDRRPNRFLNHPVSRNHPSQTHYRLG